MANKIGQAIKQIRKKKGVSQGSVARALGITSASVSGMESRDDLSLRIKTITKVLDLLEYDMTIVLKKSKSPSDEGITVEVLS
jgi:transcriptional regulator with XRE-family HTH domain